MQLNQAVAALFLLFISVLAKVYDRCELAKELRYQHNVTLDEIGVWVCIADKQSLFNTSALSRDKNTSYYGMFQISDEYWCSSSGKGLACDINCQYFHDDIIEDDFKCARIIYEEQGFKAWPSDEYCQSQANSYTQGCFVNDPTKFSTPKPKSQTKVYERCELARELRYKFNIPEEQIATWVCIAKQESNFSTSAVRFLNADSSGGHGLFQINDAFWCSPTGDGTGCDLSCSKLVDTDIADDVECVKKIYAKQAKISGDGFNAWSVYPTSCKGQASLQYVEECSIDDEDASNFVTAEPETVIQTPKPKSRGKVYERCELANELVSKHNIPMEQVGTWVCIVQHESNFSTSAVNFFSADGSASHGLFQISDKYWCSPPGKVMECGISCSDLEDSDIIDDVECAKKIYEAHNRISGDGFNAWAVYNSNCQGRTQDDIERCLDNNQKVEPSGTKPSGKIYEQCELANELVSKHNISKEQVATWVCIAKHESNFNTSAVGRKNADGSEDHGLFQISDSWWCSTPGKGKGCEISCSDLKNNDITDDVECAKKIYEAHTQFSENGFAAWTVYESNCQGRAHDDIERCFKNDKISTTERTPTTVQTTTRKPTGKVYEPCELAMELLNKHKIPKKQVATWVCIAKHESNFNTSALTYFNADGSGNHGLFKISETYWCSPHGKGKVCGISCSDLLDDDITDDVECVKTIYKQHAGISGDGFNAWAVYPTRCKGKSQRYIKGCFKDEYEYDNNNKPSVNFNFNFNFIFNFNPINPTSSKIASGGGYEQVNTVQKSTEISELYKVANRLFQNSDWGLLPGIGSVSDEDEEHKTLSDEDDYFDDGLDMTLTSDSKTITTTQSVVTEGTTTTARTSTPTRNWKMTHTNQLMSESTKLATTQRTTVDFESRPTSKPAAMAHKVNLHQHVRKRLRKVRVVRQPNQRF